ncbi:MAG: polysaccharide biosynthesis C-terminal domain-containing protein [Bacteroidetes bacterium]|nr:polysaccharide biosynthesis C-terminal domain-containing protein [Bacteroidota bacterium]
MFSFILICLLLAFIISVFPTHFYSLFSKFDSASFIQNKRLYYISAFIFPLMILTNYTTQILSSFKHFTFPMLVSIINALLSIILVLVYYNEIGIDIALWAMIIGYILNLVWLFYYLVKKLNWSFTSFEFPKNTVLLNIVMIELNILPVSYYSFLTIYLLSGLGEGIISSFTYGQMIGLIPETLILAQIGNVMNIKFNELASKSQFVELDIAYRKTLKIVFLCFVPIATFIFLISDEIVYLLSFFMEKKEFHSNNNIAFFIGCFALIIPFRAFSNLTSNLLTSMQKIREGLFIAISYQITLAISLYLFIHYFKLSGLLFNNVFTHFLILPLFFYFFIRRILPFVQLNVWLVDSLKFLTIFFIGIACIYLLKQYLPPFSQIGNIFYYLTNIVWISFLTNQLSAYFPINQLFDK